MKSAFKILFYLKRGAISANGCALIMGRITVDGVETRFSTKLDVKPEEWDTKGNRATGRSNASKQVNSLLEEIKASFVPKSKQFLSNSRGFCSMRKYV